MVWLANKYLHVHSLQIDTMYHLFQLVRGLDVFSYLSQHHVHGKDQHSLTAVSGR